VGGLYSNGQAPLTRPPRAVHPQSHRAPPDRNNSYVSGIVLKLLARADAGTGFLRMRGQREILPPTENLSAEVNFSEISDPAGK